MDLLLFITGIAGLCVISFLVGLLAWFKIHQKSELFWLKEMRTMLILFTVIGSMFVFLILLMSAIAIPEPKSQVIIKKAWPIIAPLILSAILGSHILALHLKIKRLERHT